MDHDTASYESAGADIDSNTRQMAMFIHLSTLAGYLVPLAGFVLPIVLWQTKKEEMPEIDAHGKMVVNFMLSFLIWGAVCVVLMLAVVGIFLLMLLSVLAVVFPIIGGIKANEGKLWKYPLTIEFLK